MKTAKFLQNEVAKLFAQCHDPLTEDKEVKKLKKRITFLKTCMYYMQTEPSMEFLEKEKDRLNNRINMFMETYVPLDSTKYMKKDLSAHKKGFEKEMGIPKIKSQLVTINFLLN